MFLYLDKPVLYNSFIMKICLHRNQEGHKKKEEVKKMRCTEKLIIIISADNEVCIETDKVIK